MNKENKEGTGENIFSFILYRYLPYWPLFLGLLLFFAAAAVGYILYTTPLYEATATIMVKDDKKGADETNVDDQLDLLSSKKIVENEIEVIQSYKLMKQVATELNLYIPIYEEGAIKTTSAYNTSPVTIIARHPEKLRADTVKIYFSVRGGKEISMNNKIYPINQWITTSYGDLKFIPNTNKTMDPEDPLYFIVKSPGYMATLLGGILKVNSPNKLSTVVTITMRDDFPQRAEAILNKLIEVYNRSSVNDKNRLAQNTLAFIDERLQSVEKELDSLEGRIQQYRASKNVIDLSAQSKLILDNVGITDRQIAELNTKLTVLNEVDKYVNSKDANAGIVPSTLGIDDPNLSQLVQRLSNDQLELEKLRQTTGSNNPAVVPIAKEIEQLRPKIIENINTQRTSLLASRGSLSATSGGYNAMLNTIPQKERELAEISRQQTIKNSVYSFLLQKREQTALTISSNMPDSQIIDSAKAGANPVTPRKPLILGVAVICALLLGVGIVSGKELLNRKIMFRSEIDSYTSIPVVAEIPNVKKKESLLNNKSHGSVAAEQFRQLRAAIGLYNSNLNQKRLLVTSSISGEGKSYISTNLAVSFAISGKRVALLDLDIRNPKVTSVMGLSGEAGIVEFLTGKKTPQEIINKTEYENLFVIGAGGNSDEAMELILSGKLNDLLQAIQDDFDYIVMDTSPIDPVTDAYVFSDYCDRTLFVVRHAYTPKTIVQLFDENGKIKALKNPVIVFNDVRSRGFLKGTYGYGYGYGYSSVYKVENKTKRRKKMLEI